MPLPTKTVSAVLLVLGLASCNRSAVPNPHQPPPPLGASLPRGWAWPPSAPPASPAPIAVVPGVLRPFDLSALQALTRPSGCVPFELSPGLWVTPTCGLPDILKSPAIPFRSSFQGSGPVPPSADLRTLGLDGPVKDQQQTGVCWSFAISSLIENGLRRAGNRDVVAPLHLIATDAFDKLFQLGKSDRAYTQEVVWPYEPVKACKFEEGPDTCEQAYHVKANSAKSDPMLMAELERANASGLYFITKVEKLKVPLQFDELAQVVASGREAYISINIDSVSWRGKGGYVPDYASADRGSHAVVAMGFRTTAQGREILVHNSWGASWGEGGYAWIGESTLARHGNHAFIIEVAGGGTPAVPNLGIPGLPSLGGGSFPFPFPFPGGGGQPQQPQPAGGGCAAGQIKDALLGVCTNACANGQPPFAGVCVSGGGGGGGAQVPAPQPSSQCPSGQVMDWALARCSAPCKNGLPPFAGSCLP